MTYDGYNWTHKGVIIYQTPDEQEVFRKELRGIRAKLDSGDLNGELIEVGVYQGGTAAIIREEVLSNELYLFDTFSGLPDEMDESDPKWYIEGHCAADDSYVKKVMENQEKVFIIKGIFPKCAGMVKNKKFAFAHIDVDTYNGTFNSLEFIYPRMEIGGTLIIHDYFAHPGVVKAVDKFLEGKKADNEIKQSENRQLIIYRKK